MIPDLDAIRPFEPQELEGLRLNIQAAHDELHALCEGPGRTGGKRFRMRIPVHDEDTDVVLGRGLTAGDVLLAEVDRLRARVAELEAALQEGVRIAYDATSPNFDAQARLIALGRVCKINRAALAQESES
jgi:hypothetical protein